MMHRTKIESIENHATDLQLLSMSSDSKDLGMISPKSQTLDLQLHNSSTILEITQSISSLNSQNSSTGFMIWRICPIFMDFITSVIDLKGKFVFELGSGIGGLGPLIVGKKCTDNGLYIASDQWHLLKLLKKNIIDNLHEAGLNDRVVSKTLELDETSTKKKNNTKSKGRNMNVTNVNIEVCCFDWENIDQGLYNLKELNSSKEYPDFIVGCDIVYNDYLIPFLIDSIVRLSGPNTKIIIGLQLRLLDNIESFIQQILDLQMFDVSIYDEFPSEFKELQNGFVIYYIERK